MKALILCGGRGTRAYPHTVDLPKPLMEIDGAPVLGQVMEIYAEQGFTEFVLAAGFRWELIRDFARSLPTSWSVEVRDTGLEANTGERVERCRASLGDEFFVTYGDGLGDVDLRALLRYHRQHRGAATLTTVPLPSQYGTVEIAAGGRVDGFVEKPRLRDHHINAGFFAMSGRVFDFWQGCDLERDVLPALGRSGELYAYAHEGFWRSMDTYKDSLELTALCANGKRPWLHGPVG